MSAGFDFDISELEGDFSDVAVENPSDYQDQTGSAPLQPGIYEFRVLEGGRRKNQDGEPIDDNGYPQFQLTKLEIVAPEEFKGREVYPFASYSLKPQESGPRKGTIPAVDLLRAFDDTLTFSNGKEALQLIGQSIEAGKTFRAGTNWKAFDSDYLKEVLEENGTDSVSDLDEDVRRDVFKKASFRGQKKFPKNNGFYLPEVEGPSGAILEAKLSVTRLYPSSKEVKKMGPSKGKAGSEAKA